MSRTARWVMVAIVVGSAWLAVTSRAVCFWGCEGQVCTSDAACAYPCACLIRPGGGHGFCQ